MKQKQNKCTSTNDTDRYQHLVVHRTYFAYGHSNAFDIQS